MVLHCQVSSRVVVEESEEEFEDAGKKKSSNQNNPKRNCRMSSAKPGTSLKIDSKYESPKKGPPRRLTKTSTFRGNTFEYEI